MEASLFHPLPAGQCWCTELTRTYTVKSDQEFVMACTPQPCTNHSILREGNSPAKLPRTEVNFNLHGTEEVSAKRERQLMKTTILIRWIPIVSQGITIKTSPSGYIFPSFVLFGNPNEQKFRAHVQIDVCTYLHNSENSRDVPILQGNKETDFLPKK